MDSIGIDDLLEAVKGARYRNRRSVEAFLERCQEESARSPRDALPLVLEAPEYVERCRGSLKGQEADYTVRAYGVLGTGVSLVGSFAMAAQAFEAGRPAPGHGVRRRRDPGRVVAPACYNLPSMSFQTLLARLDRLPFGGVLAGGVGLGIGLGLLALFNGTAGFWGALLVGAAAVALGVTGQPVWEEEPTEGAVVPEPADLFEMVPIEGGTFVMGSPEDEPDRRSNERQHQVTVSSFLMSATAITRGMYRDVMEIDEAPGPGGDNHPVTRVSWRDAVEFCNRASERAGFEPCYRIEGEDVEWTGGNGYRLPTEAEWEYAARAGATTRWSFGDDESKLGEYAWYAENSSLEAHSVATRKPNPWGLYDMHGNVWEWCWDPYGEYPTEPVTDPRRPAGTPSALRVLRGGSFADGPWWLRSAVRNWVGPEDRVGRIGLRCVRRARPQP